MRVFEVDGVRGMDSGRVAALSRASEDFVRRVIGAQNAALEAACRDVAALGYTVSDLRVCHHPPGPGPHHLSLLVLQVRGRDAVEIETEFKGLTVVVTSKVVAWPKPVDIEPQGPAADTGE